MKKVYALMDDVITDLALGKTDTDEFKEKVKHSVAVFEKHRGITKKKRKQERKNRKNGRK